MAGIQTNITFVLGAGASIPYGFISGEQLRIEICQLADTSDFLNTASACGISRFTCEKFARAFRDSATTSIDAFLGRQTQFAEIGKLAIAFKICQLESHVALFNPSNAEDWYRYFWNALISDADNVEDVPFSKIKVVTFNYDRSFEHFLHTATVNTFGITDEEATKRVSELQLVHVYGALGEYCHTRKELAQRAYEPISTAPEFQIMARQIKVIPEARLDDEVFERARELCTHADKICFLGFGFDPLNVRRLNIPSVLDWAAKNRGTSPPMIASTFGMTGAEIARGTWDVSGKYGMNTFSATNLQTLRESGLLL